MAIPAYDVIVIGSGPGGYECAIRASQLGLKTAIVEKDKLGGVCTNIGCIPTKALLKSAEVAHEVQHISDYGLEVTGALSIPFDKVIERSRKVADKMSRGVAFLMQKNKIDVYYGFARFVSRNRLDIQPSVNFEGKEVGEPRQIEGSHIIVATGARPRELPNLPIDGKKIISYKEAMLQKTKPESLLIVGAGAIGVEFAYFYHNMGTQVTIVELMDRLVPLEDADCSKELERAFRKAGITVMTGSTVEKVDRRGKKCKVTVKTPRGEKVMEVEQVLSAVGVVGNVENMGLEDLGVEIEKNTIKHDEFYRTNVPGIYAIGDVAGPPWLAHVASHEGIICVEKIAGLDPHPLNYENIPGCTYCQPQIASVGLTEAQALERGYEIKVGKFPFTASGKATAIGDNSGFVKVIFDAKYGEWLGCHIVGHDATEMIAEAVVARTLETTAEEIIESIHPHPTLSEAIVEATLLAYGRPINF